jgi:hypothetical protein
MWTDPGNIEIAHKQMNMEIGTEAAHFPEKEFINGIFIAVHLMVLELRDASHLLRYRHILRSGRD